jgi:hypothetical protein
MTKTIAPSVPLTQFNTGYLEGIEFGKKLIFERLFKSKHWEQIEHYMFEHELKELISLLKE